MPHVSSEGPPREKWLEVLAQADFSCAFPEELGSPGMALHDVPFRLGTLSQPGQSRGTEVVSRWLLGKIHSVSVSGPG